MRIVEEDIDGESMLVTEVSLLRMVGFKLGPTQKCLDLWKHIPTNVVTTGAGSIPDAVSTVSASSSAFNIESPQHHVYILLKNMLGSTLNSCPETFTASSTETFGSLLQLFLESKPEKKDEYNRLLTYPTTVYCYDTAECNLRKRVRAALTDSCETLGNHSLRFITHQL